MGELPFNLLTFPLWWYSTGFRHFFSWLKKTQTSAYYQSDVGLIIREIYTHRQRQYSLLNKLGLFGFGFFLLFIKILFFLSINILLILLGLLYIIILPAVISLVLHQLFLLA